MLNDFVKGSITCVSWNNLCNHTLLIDDRNPRFSMNAPVMNCLLLRILVVVYMDKGHSASVKVHQSTDEAGFMDAWCAMYGSSEKNQERTVMKKRMAYAFPMKMIRNIHRAEVRVTLTDPEHGIMADGRHRSFFGEG
jgi:hypothetical protein